MRRALALLGPLAALPALALAACGPPAGEIVRVDVLLDSAVYADTGDGVDKTPDLLVVTPWTRPGACADLAGATATMNGQDMEVASSGSDYDPLYGMWRCGLASASLDLDTIVAPGDEAADAEIVVQGQHADLRIVVPDLIAAWRLALSDATPARGAPLGFSLAPADGERAIGFAALRDGAGPGIDLAVSADEEAEGAFVAQVPADAPLGPTQAQIRVELPRAATTCEGADTCAVNAARFEAIDVEVVAP